MKPKNFIHIVDNKAAQGYTWQQFDATGHKN